MALPSPDELRRLKAIEQEAFKRREEEAARAAARLRRAHVALLEEFALRAKAIGVPPYTDTTGVVKLSSGESIEWFEGYFAPPVRLYVSLPDARYQITDRWRTRRMGKLTFIRVFHGYDGGPGGGSILGPADPLSDLSPEALEEPLTRCLLQMMDRR